MSAAVAEQPATAASTQPMQSTKRFKLVILGDEAVGKTSVVTRFMYDTFPLVHRTTIGIDFVSKNVYLGQKCCRLQLWDTAGQERFRSLIPSYVRDSSVVILVFDVTARLSFTNTQAWVKDAREGRGGDVMVVLVGNKADLGEQRQVSEDEARHAAKALGVAYFESSAKTGAGVRELFMHIAEQLTNGATTGAAAQAAALPQSTTTVDIAGGSTDAAAAGAGMCGGVC